MTFLAVTILLPLNVSRYGSPKLLFIRLLTSFLWFGVRSNRAYDLPYLDATSGVVVDTSTALTEPDPKLVSAAGSVRFTFSLLFTAGALTLAILLRRDTQYRQRHIELDVEEDETNSSSSAPTSTQDALVLEEVVRCTIHVTGLPLRSAAYHRANPPSATHSKGEAAAAEGRAQAYVASVEDEQDWVQYFRSLVAPHPPASSNTTSVDTAGGPSSAASAPQHPLHPVHAPRSSLTFPSAGSELPHPPLTPNQPHAFFDSQPRGGSLVAAIPHMVPDQQRTGAVMVAPSAPGSCATTPRGGAGSFASLPSAAVPGADRGLAISVASTPRLLTPPHGFVGGSAFTPPHHQPSALHKLRNISPSRFLHHTDAAPAEDPIIAAAHVAHDLTAVQELLRKRYVQFGQVTTRQTLQFSNCDRPLSVGMTSQRQSNVGFDCTQIQRRKPRLPTPNCSTCTLCSSKSQLRSALPQLTGSHIPSM